MRDSEVEVFVEGEEDGHDRGGVVAVVALDELTIALAEVIGAAAGYGVRNLQVGVLLGDDSHDGQGRLSAL